MPGVYRQREGEYDILSLNEINSAIDYGMIQLGPVLAELRARPDGITARRGIEY